MTREGSQIVRQVGSPFIDIGFEPNEKAIRGRYEEKVEEEMTEGAVHWRRPREFMINAEYPRPVMFSRPDIKDPS